MRVMFGLNIPLTAGKHMVNQFKLWTVRKISMTFILVGFSHPLNMCFLSLMATGHYKLLLNSKGHIMVLKNIYSILFHRKNNSI